MSGKYKGRRKNIEKHKAVRKFLDNDEDCLWTDAHIAEQCQVSVSTVSRLRLADPNHVHLTKRKRLNDKGEIEWIRTKRIGKGQPRLDSTSPPVKVWSFNPLLSNLKTDLSTLITHTEASIMVVCAAEEFLEILSAYMPQDKPYNGIDTWGDTNGNGERQGEQSRGL